MAFQKHNITALMDAGLMDQAAEQVLAAYIEGNASQLAAAEKLNCSEGTLIRWVKRMKMSADMAKKHALGTTALTMVAALAKVKKKAIKEGWHHDRNRRGGRPRKRAA